jgi:hypothetical protein
VETRRTNSFLRFALGARSPDKKNYFRSKLFTAPEEARLKIKSEGEENPNRSMYNNNRTGISFKN